MKRDDLIRNAAEALSSKKTDDVYATVLSEFAAAAVQIERGEENFLDDDAYDKLRTKYKDSILDYQGLVQEGMQYYLIRDHSGTIQDMLKKLSEYKKQIDEAEEPLEVPHVEFTDEEFGVLLDIGIDAYQGKEYAIANSMMTVIAGLFPNRVQPYIVMADIVVKQQGVSVGLLVYENLIQMMKDPMLFYHASDTYLEEGSQSSRIKATELLKEAIEMCTHGDENHQVLKNELEEMLARAL